MYQISSWTARFEDQVNWSSWKEDQISRIWYSLTSPWCWE